MGIREYVHCIPRYSTVGHFLAFRVEWDDTPFHIRDIDFAVDPAGLFQYRPDSQHHRWLLAAHPWLSRWIAVPCSEF